MSSGLNRCPDLAAFATVIDALRPYLGSLVFVGGWVQLFYGLDPRGRQLDFGPLHTDDLDVAAPLRLPAIGEGIADRLKAAGFREELSGADHPPVAAYRLGESSDGFEVEFIAAQMRSGRKRTGAPDSTEVTAGVVVQKLRFVDLLLIEPWMIELGPDNGFPLSRSTSIRIPHPACYLAQKVLALPARKTHGKDSKDVLYMYDTILRFSERLSELHEDWRSFSQGGQIDARLQAGIDGLLQNQRLAEKAAEVARRSGRPSPPLPAEVLATCGDGLSRIFALD